MSTDDNETGGETNPKGGERDNAGGAMPPGQLTGDAKAPDADMETSLETALEEGNVFLAPDKTLVRRAVNKGGRLGQNALLYQVRPELQ